MNLEEDQVFPDYDDGDGSDLKPLPNFIPPESQEAQEVVQAAVETPEASPSPIEDNAPVTDVDGAAADGGDSTDTPDPLTSEQEESADLPPDMQQVEAVPADTIAETDDDKVTLDRSTYEALMEVARTVNAGAVLVDPEELKRVNAVLEQSGMVSGADLVDHQQQMKTGVIGVTEGGMSLISGTSALTEAALRAGGKVASSLAGVLWGGDDKAPPTAGVTVLPRISEYRVGQAEKAANAYEDAMERLWESGNLSDVRKEIEERARQTGLSVEDVMDKMRPNGEMADLHEKFRTAMAESPDAQGNKKAMDKALDGWMRQYGRGQEELLNPETKGSPHFEALRNRLDKSHERMKENTANAPLFEGEETSHAEKLQGTIQRIMEKLKQIARDFLNMVRGRKGADAEAASASSP